MPIQKRNHKIGRKALALAALAAVLPLPLVGGAWAEETADDASFEQSFEKFETLPKIPSVPANAVDISQITPPAEIEQAPATRSLGSGVASYYGKRFHGRRTASGERFNMNDYTAAHKTLPFGTRVLVTNPNNGKTVTVRINDRGPYAHGRMIDLSRAAAEEIGLVSRGHGRVQLEAIS